VRDANVDGRRNRLIGQALGAGLGAPTGDDRHRELDRTDHGIRTRKRAHRRSSRVRIPPTRRVIQAPQPGAALPSRDRNARGDRRLYPRAVAPSARVVWVRGTACQAVPAAWHRSWFVGKRGQAGLPALIVLELELELVEVTLLAPVWQLIGVAGFRASVEQVGGDDTAEMAAASADSPIRVVPLSRPRVSRR